MNNKGDVVIREMDEEDAKRFEEKLHAIGYALSLYQSYLDETVDEACEYFVAYYKGERAGFAKLDWQSSYEDFEEKQIPEIKDLWVFEEYRGRGIAKALMQHLEKKASKRSKLCGVGVGLSEEFEAAQSLFDQLGYKPDGKGIFYIESDTVRDELEVDDNQALMMIKYL